MIRSHLVLISLATIVLAAGIGLGLFYFSNISQEAQVTPPAVQDPTPIMITGEMTCLPKIGTGPQTLECAIGLQADDDNYYALRDLFEHDPDYSLSQTGIRVEVSGILTQEVMLGPDGNQYDIAGVISITSIKQL